MARSKFGAVRTTVDNITFASKAEARHYGHLKMLEKAGEIRKLKLQPKFRVFVAGKLVCTYIADFDYERKDGKRWVAVIADVKGMKTPVYKLKKKLVEALYGIQITEVA